MRIHRLLIWTCCAVVGVAAFWFWQRRVERRLGQAEAVLAEQAQALELLRASRAELIKEGEALAAGRAAVMAKQAHTALAALSVRENLQVLAEMRRRKLFPTWQLPFANSRTGEIEPGFFEAMAFGAEERKTFEQAWREAQEKIAAGVAANASLEKGGDGTLTFRITPFAGGEAIYDGLLHAVESILGRADAGAFTTLFGEQMSKELAQFGMGEWVLKLRPQVAPSPDGVQRYQVSDSRTRFIRGNQSAMATPRDSSLRAANMGTIGTATMTLPDFARRHPALAKLVPGSN